MKEQMKNNAHEIIARVCSEPRPSILMSETYQAKMRNLIHDTMERLVAKAGGNFSLPKTVEEVEALAEWAKGKEEPLPYIYTSRWIYKEGGPGFIKKGGHYSTSLPYDAGHGRGDFKVRCTPDNLMKLSERFALRLGTFWAKRNRKRRIERSNEEFTMLSMRFCKFCEKKLPDDARIDTKFCSAKCRVAAHRADAKQDAAE